MIIDTAILLMAMTTPAAAPVPTVPPRNTFRPAPPNLYTKQAFRVTPAEAPLLDMINAASNSIAAFIVERNNLAYDPEWTKLAHVLPQAIAHMRLPPSTRANPQLRYTPMLVYNWKKIDPNRLQFDIEFADPGAPAERYTDSFVFIRAGPGWYFEKHGSTPPRSWRK